jgi:hypothetical protein
MLQSVVYLPLKNFSRYNSNQHRSIDNESWGANQVERVCDCRVSLDSA